MRDGVDLYIGGIEHAVMHLLYARFFTKFTRDAGMNDVGEPFGTLLCQGMLNAPAPYCAECNSEYHVDYFDSNCPSCEKPLSRRSAKMSKSLGNTVNPEEMISKYGADTVRLFILFGANPEAGMDWSDNEIESRHRQIFSIIDAIDSALDLKESPSPIDDWLVSVSKNNHSEWKTQMKQVSIREGVMISHFKMLSDWNWYIRRGGRNKIAAYDFLEHWIPMLAPVTPHIAEEFWSKMDPPRTLLAEHNLEAPIMKLHRQPDGSVKFHEHNPSINLESFLGPTGYLLRASPISKEEYLIQLIEDARKLRKLAERHLEGPISRLVIQTAPKWKSDLAFKVAHLSVEDHFDFEEEGHSYLQSLEIFENKPLRGEVLQTWNALTGKKKQKLGRRFTWTSHQRFLLSDKWDETKFIFQNSEFIAESLDVESVEVYRVGEGKDVGGKARISFPLEPGIAFV
jgi:leucyl-tRNA synthetase